MDESLCTMDAVQIGLYNCVLIDCMYSCTYRPYPRAADQWEEKNSGKNAHVKRDLKPNKQGLTC